AAARVSPVRRATSLSVSSGLSALNARITERPRASDCTKSPVAASAGGSSANCTIRTPIVYETLPFQNDGEALADADADRGDRDTTPATSKFVRSVTDDPTTGSAERMPHRKCTTVDVDLVGVELRPPL